MLDHILYMVSNENNGFINAHPHLEEVKTMVFELNGKNAYGPDGFTGPFFQKCYDIIGQYVWKVVKAFFEGITLPKSINHTNLVLLQKKILYSLFLI